MRKGAKSDFTDLEKGPLERFKQTRLLPFISTHPGKFYAKIEKKLLNRF